MTQEYTAIELRLAIASGESMYRIFYAHVWESHYLYTDSLGLDRYSVWSIYCSIEAWESSAAYQNGAKISQ